MLFSVTMFCWLEPDSWYVSVWLKIIAPRLYPIGHTWPYLNGHVPFLVHLYAEVVICTMSLQSQLATQGLCGKMRMGSILSESVYVWVKSKHRKMRRVGLFLEWAFKHPCSGYLHNYQQYVMRRGKGETNSTDDPSVAGSFWMLPEFRLNIRLAGYILHGLRKLLWGC